MGCADGPGQQGREQGRKACCERVFWGTDVTGLRCSWREAVTMVTEEMDFLSQEDKTWIMGRGVRQWLNWT